MNIKQLSRLTDEELLLAVRNEHPLDPLVAELATRLEVAISMCVAALRATGEKEVLALRNSATALRTLVEMGAA